MQSSLRHLHLLKTMTARAPAAVTWAEQWDDLKVMWNDGLPTDEIAENLGRSVSAVLTQAARLGLARRSAPGRKAQAAPLPSTIRRAVHPDQASNVIAFHAREEAAILENTAPRHEKRERSCLMCSTSFTSIGSHNRICPRCKSGSAYQVGHDESFRVLSA